MSHSLNKLLEGGYRGFRALAIKVSGFRVLGFRV